MKQFKSGSYISQGSYRSFQPAPINRSWKLDDMKLLDLLTKTERALGRLDMYSEYVNIDLFIRMHIAKEATQSSRIEGTQTNMEEVFMDQADISAEKRDDWLEVQNYISAMNEAVRQLERLPFSSRLIRLTHKILLNSARGNLKLPGEYRSSQNWIGGATINDAVFVPPVHSSIGDLMSDLEKFANDEHNYLPDLLKIAIIHYQFETIHPFLDGNGRVGRLLITLYLVNKGILKKPILYLSDYFERHRSLYYDNLTRVRTHNDITQWLKFFLVGVQEIAENGVQTFDRILKLQTTLSKKLHTLGSRMQLAQTVINRLYEQPVVSPSQLETITGRARATNYKILHDLERLGVIRKISEGQRNKLYVFQEYLDLFR